MWSRVIWENLAVANQVGPGVADVGEADPGTRSQQCRDRRPHAAQRRVGRDHVPQRPLGALHRVAKRVEQLTRRHLGVQRPQRLDHRGAGDLAGRMPAQPVGDGEQPAARVRGVLVVRAHQADVGPHRIADGEFFLGGIRHGSVLPGQVANKEGRKLTPGGVLGLDLGPVVGQLARRQRR